MKYLTWFTRAKPAADTAVRPENARLKNRPDRPGTIRERGDERVAEAGLDSQRLQIERKIFFLDLKENASGRFLRITEEVGSRRDSIIVPATGLEAFRSAIDRAMRAAGQTS